MDPGFGKMGKNEYTGAKYTMKPEYRFDGNLNSGIKETCLILFSTIPCR